MKLIENYKRYKIVQCKCGNYSTSEAKLMFHCRYCDKVYPFTKIDPKKGTYLNLKILFDTDNPLEATKTLLKFKNEKYNVNEGFGTYKRK